MTEKPIQVFFSYSDLNRLEAVPLLSVGVHLDEGSKVILPYLTARINPASDTHWYKLWQGQHQCFRCLHLWQIQGELLQRDS